MFTIVSPAILKIEKVINRDGQKNSERKTIQPPRGMTKYLWKINAMPQLTYSLNCTTSYTRFKKKMGSASSNFILSPKWPHSFRFVKRLVAFNWKYIKNVGRIEATSINGKKKGKKDASRFSIRSTWCNYIIFGVRGVNSESVMCSSFTFIIQ